MDFKELLPRYPAGDIYARHQVREWFGFPEKRIVSDWVWCTPGRRTRTKSAPSLRDLSDDLRLSDEEDIDQGYCSRGSTSWKKGEFEVLVLPQPQTTRTPAIPKPRWTRSNPFIEDIRPVVPGPRRPEVTPRRGRRKASPNLNSEQMHEAKRRKVGDTRKESLQKRQEAMVRSQKDGCKTFILNKDTSDRPDPFRRPASADAILSMPGPSRLPQDVTSAQPLQPAQP
ncbi:uncharacterized protein LOC127751498 [Frankliniella occidentalis]|uniref:Uncharacterized protein LOC127751498 n=1 Tax=Frankliniella occidentalis TaxID=133901 RepID=A0A9C6XUI2_FRAOC|nr:uncharacterized protein LOC127751498 [Frankliniella occidentalis]